MKKIKFSGKLNLNKETITKLDNNQMSAINGGISGRACEPRLTDKCQVYTYQSGEECLSAGNGTRCLDTINCL